MGTNKEFIETLPAKQLKRIYIEQMEEHRLYAASAFYDELKRRGYVVRFVKPRGSQ